ncbi:MAG TPA: hypothetical protein PK263_01900 [bacterium]|nr:hypothetical protein [bacterium]
MKYVWIVTGLALLVLGIIQAKGGTLDNIGMSLLAGIMGIVAFYIGLRKQNNKGGKFSVKSLIIGLVIGILLLGIIFILYLGQDYF